MNDLMTQVSEIVAQFKSIDDLAEYVLDKEQAYCPIYHHFGPGIYMREVNFPAGVVAVGRHQKYPQMNIMLRGHITMFMADKQIEIKAPLTFMGSPGQKAGFIHEDVCWLNVYATDETDVETLENTYFEKNEMSRGAKPPTDRSEDIADYHKFLKDTGITEEFVRKETEDESNLIPFPYGRYAVAVYPSDIQGRGLHASAHFFKDEVITVARIGDKRTPAGRYINHSKHPNARMQWAGDTIEVVANTFIGGTYGGMNGDEITVNYRHVLKDIHNQGA